MTLLRRGETGTARSHEVAPRLFVSKKGDADSLSTSSHPCNALTPSILRLMFSARARSPLAQRVSGVSPHASVATASRSRSETRRLDGGASLAIPRRSCVSSPRRSERRSTRRRRSDTSPAPRARSFSASTRLPRQDLRARPVRVCAGRFLRPPEGRHTVI